MAVADLPKGAAEVEKARVRFKKRSQITLPKSIVDALNLREGDQLDVRLEDGRIILEPTITIPRSQAWFWSEKWQAMEGEAEEDLRAGRVHSFKSADELIDWLESDE